MAVALEILYEGHIIKLTVSDPWHTQDLTSLYPQEQLYFDSASYKVHTLVDLRKMRGIPPEALLHRKSPNVTHPNSGQVAIVGATPLARMMAEIAFDLLHFKQARFFATESDAQAYLEQLVMAEAVGTPIEKKTLFNQIS